MVFDAINNIRQRVSREPVVQVEDENHKPVAGAVVVFTLPTEGATGEFGNGSKNLTVTTDAQGRDKRVATEPKEFAEFKERALRSLMEGAR